MGKINTMYCGNCNCDSCKKTRGSSAGGPKVVVYTDGACQGNGLVDGGAGGWCAIVKLTMDDGSVKEEVLDGHVDGTTSNRMEMFAAISGLKAIKDPSHVIVYSDSQYLIKGITSWVKKWIKNGWRSVDRTPVKNKDLWQELIALTKIHKIEWKWVKGHSGDLDNERADDFANAAAASF